MDLIALFYKIMCKRKAIIIKIISRKNLKTIGLCEFEKLLLVFGNKTLIRTQQYKISFKIFKFKYYTIVFEEST